MFYYIVFCAVVDFTIALHPFKMNINHCQKHLTHKRPNVINMSTTVLRVVWPFSWVHEDHSNILPLPVIPEEVSVPEELVYLLESLELSPLTASG